MVTSSRDAHARDMKKVRSTVPERKMGDSGLRSSLRSLLKFLPVFEGNVAAVTFTITSFLLVVLWRFTALSSAIIIFLEFCCVLVLLALWKPLPIARVILLSHLLGLALGVGVLIQQVDSEIRYVGVYLIFLSFFHCSEFVVTDIYNSRTLTLDSFLINHSKEYVIAAVVSWIEYALEYYYCPWIKSLYLISWLGLGLVLFGEFLRKLAMLTATSNFTHNIQFYKRHGHQLVTWGIYKYFRHPSYVGWFYWSVGTQLLLCNPVCAVAYVIASWLFFRDRILCEEESLIHFFGQEYIDYQKQVGTGLPFINGYVLLTESRPN